MDAISIANKYRTLIGVAILLSLSVFARAQQPDSGADQQFQAGLAFAKEQRWVDARQAFLAGQQRFPSDARFPTELGGVAFKERNYEEAVRWLKVARKLNPGDTYVNDFLGTVFYITGNRYAALNSWNRAGKPILANVRTEPTPKLDPVILDRAFDFAPGDKLTSAQLLTTEARLRELDVFSKSDFYIAAREDGKFDATLYADERHGFGRNKWEALFSIFSGAISLSVIPRYYNVEHTGTNISSLVRFNPERRRGTLTLSGPIRRNPKWHYILGGDYRNENWNVRNFSSVPGSQLGSLNMRRTAASADIESINSGKFSWSVGGEYSYRDFRDAIGAELPADLLKGSQLKQRARINYEIARLPEQHLVINSYAISQLGRLWADDGGHTFYKIQGSAGADWFLSPKGDDYEMQERLSAGRIDGGAPFDELYMLGLDLDDQLVRMRAHYATDRGRKGNAPLGSRYFVSNWELDKQVHSNGVFRVTVGPFVDTGKITGPSPQLGSDKWLTDVGAQTKIKAFGMQVVLVYGKDLRTGDNAIYMYLAH